MTYNVNLPLVSDKIRNFPGDVTTNNWPRLKTIVGVDHQFNNSATANDGYHTIIHMIPQAAPSPLVGFGQAYGKTFLTNVYPFYQRASGAETMVPLCGAMGLFDGTGAIVGNSYNVNACSVLGTGKYVVNMPADLGTSTYTYSLSQQIASSGSADVNCMVVVAQSSNQLAIEFRRRTSGSNEYYTPTRFCVTINVLG